jgi:hypothetical protein
MANVHFDSTDSDDERRRRLYAGDLYMYSPVKPALELVALAREMITRAFGARDPEKAQYEMPVTEYAALLAELKPRFIHHPDCKRLLPQILAALGCEPASTYFDVPRMRSSTSDNFLTTGIAYAFHPHRDTWYSAPMCQINWWLPISGLTADNGMAFHPAYFARALRNSSNTYDYQRWNQVPSRRLWSRCRLNRTYAWCRSPAASSSFRARNCIPRCRTCPAVPASASTFAP